jgi:hypothetical protein
MPLKFDSEAAARRWENYMLQGKFEQAWVESDTITAQGEGGTLDLWDGLPFDGKRVVVRCLHGYGDAIQFLRYARPLKSRAARVIVETHPEMVSLIERLPFADDVITWARPHGIVRSDWDQQIEVMELPRAFRTTLATIPAEVPYFDIARRSRPRLPASFSTNESRCPKIGLLWASSGWNPARSMAFDDLQPLLDLKGFSFYSFQRGSEWNQLRGNVFDTAPGAPDILDTAQDLLEIDLLITVDTMAAHLAGALAAPVWTLLPVHADWRWMLDRDDSPWYPTMRLFRQSAQDAGWTCVVHRVREALVRRFAPSGTLEPQLHPCRA